jgi:hypothetical protein
MKQNLPPLEQGLLQAMHALDSQIAREMQRSPEQLERHGLTKWEPYSKRIESVCAFLLESLGGRKMELDSIIVLSQALIKCLQIVAEDLGEEGLGKMRAGYCLAAFENMARTCQAGIQRLKREPLLA